MILLTSRTKQKSLVKFRGAYQDLRLDLISKQHLLRPVQTIGHFDII